MRCYGHLELTVTSPTQSFQEPLTLAEAKKFLELPEQRSPVDGGEDALVDALISGARVVAEYFQNRDLVLKQYDLTLDMMPYEIQLRTPVTSVDLFQWTDTRGNVTALVQGTDYIVDLARGLVIPPYGRFFPPGPFWPSGGVLLRFTSGIDSNSAFWNDTGKSVKVGMRQLIVHHYTQRVPIEMFNIAAQEYPYTITDLLSIGAAIRTPR